MLTMYDDDATVFTAMQAGARGYLLKGAEQDEIVGAIRAVVPGRRSSGRGSPGACSTTSRHRPCRRAEPFPELTDREREILDLLAAGRRTAAIAEELFLSPKTVSNHLTSIFAKLEVADRAEAIIRAREGAWAGSRDRRPDPGRRRGRGLVLVVGGVLLWRRRSGPPRRSLSAAALLVGAVASAAVPAWRGLLLTLRRALPVRSRWWLPPGAAGDTR